MYFTTALADNASQMPTPALTLAPQTRTSVIEAAAKALEEKYVFPDLAVSAPQRPLRSFTDHAEHRIDREKART
jgi:hypothetical protein